MYCSYEKTHRSEKLSEAPSCWTEIALTSIVIILSSTICTTVDRGYLVELTIVARDGLIKRPFRFHRSMNNARNKSRRHICPMKTFPVISIETSLAWRPFAEEGEALAFLWITIESREAISSLLNALKPFRWYLKHQPILHDYAWTRFFRHSSRGTREALTFCSYPLNRGYFNFMDIMEWPSALSAVVPPYISLAWPALSLSTSTPSSLAHLVLLRLCLQGWLSNLGSVWNTPLLDLPEIRITVYLSPNPLLQRNTSEKTFLQELNAFKKLALKRMNPLSLLLGMALPH